MWEKTQKEEKRANVGLDCLHVWDTISRQINMCKFKIGRAVFMLQLGFNYMNDSSDELIGSILCNLEMRFPKAWKLLIEYSQV